MDFNLLFMYFITVNKYWFCISVIESINMQIIGIGYKKKKYRSITIGNTILRCPCYTSHVLTIIITTNYA